ncbi:hypothetical protein AXF42_Ash013435 [Apostasia shenzhenica]|uniref:Uncharacterized protein n=1 Tax=Apostasia shenzhenica TaxID=1088818 RepID=A0A2I0A476_9ASPA|nr:hypothetical protein AXF42_Ash013435 [Apostasia shenzhenica]
MRWEAQPAKTEMGSLSGGSEYGTIPKHGINDGAKRDHLAILCLNSNQLCIVPIFRCLKLLHELDLSSNCFARIFPVDHPLRSFHPLASGLRRFRAPPTYRRRTATLLYRFANITKDNRTADSSRTFISKIKSPPPFRCRAERNENKTERGS